MVVKEHLQIALVNYSAKVEGKERKREIKEIKV